MRIDREHEGFARWTAGVAVLGGVALGAVAILDPRGPRGASVPGILFGLAGTALMLFAAFLFVRKRMLLVRMGPVHWWLKAHVWLGALSFVLVLYHAAFRLGGPLTTALMVLFAIVAGGGALGAVIQHILPPEITREVREGATLELAPTWLRVLEVRAYLTMEAYTGAIEDAKVRLTSELLPKIKAEALTEVRAIKERRALPKEPATSAATNAIRAFYQDHVAPYLRDPLGATGPLSDEFNAALIFAAVRPNVTEALRACLDDLEAICSSARQKALQRGRHWLLHGWLLLHVPLSVALLILTAVHAVVALRY